jgi:3',5'-cyclic AMP phosphodiesterase CpdA
MLLAQLSDPHVDEDDPAAAAALERAVRAVRELRPAPDAVLVTGDVAEHGAPGEYARARELLGPVHVLAGNHDDPGALRAAFGAGDDIRCAGYRLLLCETRVAGRDDGRLDVERLAARLAQDGDTPTIVAMHHPPVLVGIDALDAIGLPEEDRQALAAVLTKAPQVRRVIAGHVHRSASGVLGGRGVVTCGSTYRQARLELEGDALELTPDEPAGYALHFDVGGELVSHAVSLGASAKRFA